MPEQRILDDFTDAERESTDNTGGDLQAHVGSGIVVHTGEQGVDLVKSTRRRTVHFLLPGSQTPISTRSDTEDEDTAMAESVGQGWDACSEKGQLSTGPHDDGVNPVHQTVRSLSEVAFMDGASEQESIVASPVSYGPDTEANTLIENPEDATARAGELKPDISQPMDGTNGAGAHLPSSFYDQGPITGTSESVKKHWEEKLLVGPLTENVSQSYDAVIESERLANENDEDAAREVELTETVALPMSVDMDKAEPAIVSPAKNCDLNEELTAPDNTAEMTGFHDIPVDDLHAQSQLKQQNTDTPLAGKSHEQPTHQESLLQPTYVDDALWNKTSKRPLEMTSEASPAKRQRTDVALVSKTEQSPSHGESSSKAISQRDVYLPDGGEGSKIEPGHALTSAAAPHIPTSTDWTSFTVANLRKELANRGLRRGGVKTILVQRLTEYERTQAVQVSLEEPDDQSMLVEPQSEFAAKGKGKGPERTGEATVDAVSNLENGTAAAAARDENGNGVVEDLVENLVNDAIAQAGIESAKLPALKTLGGSYTAQPLALNDMAAPDLSADVEMQDILDWQDDSYEEVILLTMSPMASPVRKEPVQREMDADVSLESIEAPVVEPGIRDGTPPRITGSGTMWIAKEA